MEGTRIQKGDTSALSTSGIFYGKVLGGSATKLEHPQTPTAHTIDVRDVAKAHILALTAPPPSQVGRKRLLIAGPSLTWKNAIEHLKKARPELADRLPDTNAAGVEKIGGIDTSRSAEVLDLQEYIEWQKTAEDTADSLLAIMKEWN